LVEIDDAIRKNGRFPKSAIFIQNIISGRKSAYFLSILNKKSILMLKKHEIVIFYQKNWGVLYKNM